MKNYYVFYQPEKSKVLTALIPANSLKQALTRFNSAGFEGEIKCVKESSFDNSLFNL